MQKNILLHAAGVMALSLLCACGTAEKKDIVDEPKKEALAEVPAQPAQAVDQQAPATNAVAQNDDENRPEDTQVPTEEEKAPVAEQKA